MTSLSLTGVRGGVGVSALLAAIGHALERLGERVLLVDLCPENMLRLHFNVDASHTGGWARAMLEGQDWFEQAWSLTPTLHLLPYGTVSAAQSDALEQRLRNEPSLWARRQKSLNAHYDWILFDVPQRLPGHAILGPCLLPIQVIEADAACQILLHQQARDSLLLVNRFDPGSQLQRDLLLLWRNHHATRILPLAIHLDEAMREALAYKQPLGQYAPDSLAAQDVLSLATWCLTRRRGERS